MPLTETPAPSAAGTETTAYARDATEVLAALGVDPARGLSAAEADDRLRRHGPNLLAAPRTTSGWRILARQFESPIVWLLVAAAALSYLFGDWPDATAIAVVILINTAIGFGTEFKAVRSMEALRGIDRVFARVRRDGRISDLPAHRLVPGDIVLLDGGDVISADLRLIEAAGLSSDESPLTGESVPADKNVQPVARDAPLGDRASMAFKGTAVTRGTGEGVVVATGLATELGRISSLIEEIEDETTPLEKRLDRLATQLLWLTLVLVAVIGVAGVYHGKPILLMVETAIALAVAAVPEGLPMVSTLALARGMWRMARRNALIESLPAVETLGATTVICTDKTGTLTENRMVVRRLAGAAGDPRDPARRAALEVGALCSNATLAGAGDTGVGDPSEVALLRAAADAGIDRAGLLRTYPEVREEPFDSATKMMATIHRDGSRHLVCVKGAPEAVLAHSTVEATPDGSRTLDDDARRRWRVAVDELTGLGLRVLALARKTVDDPGEAPYRDLEILALAGMHDPPRADVAKAIAQCREAGIRVVMVTGDHGLTATAIARQIGLVDDTGGWESGAVLDGATAATTEERERIAAVPIFARVSPEQKLHLIEVYQQHGDVVAMTGDGVNDAPALKKADIGIAMGRRGTQVAREAADMVLRDDSFATIASAIEQGRIIFTNIRRFVVYLLSCNLSEILIVGIATLLGLPLPLLPLQILFLNLVTDVFPAFALGATEGAAGVMRRPPRPPGEGVLTRSQWIAIGGYGLVITFTTLGALWVAVSVLHLPEREAVTVSFLTLAIAQLWHVFNMRSGDSGRFDNEITRNLYVWAALALCAALLLGATYFAPVADVLGVLPPDAMGWSVVLGFGLVPYLVGLVAGHRR